MHRGAGPLPPKAVGNCIGASPPRVLARFCHNCVRNSCDRATVVFGSRQFHRFGRVTYQRSSEGLQSFGCSFREFDFRAAIALQSLSALLESLRDSVLLSVPGPGHSFGPFPRPAVCRASASPFRRRRVLAPPILVPPEKPLLALGALASRFGVPQDTRAEKEKNMYLNRLTLIGFIGADAETRVGSSEPKFAVFSVATKRSWKNADGGWESRTEWHRCLVIWN